MRYLGIDYGHKKVGIALSDIEGMMAFPWGVIKNDSAFFSALKDLIEKEKVAEVVIGHSKNKEGNDNPIQAAIENLITDLTLEYGLPVHLENEIYSTQEAIRLQGRNEQTDAAAAAIILNSYLTKRK